MVINHDGSRIWSPPAMVCSHCRTTIRHWQFALAWCSECERWGRRNVVSPCGQLYGYRVATAPTPFCWDAAGSCPVTLLPPTDDP